LGQFAVAVVFIVTLYMGMHASVFSQGHVSQSWVAPSVAATARPALAIRGHRIDEEPLWPGEPLASQPRQQGGADVADAWTMVGKRVGAASTAAALVAAATLNTPAVALEAGSYLQQDTAAQQTSRQGVEATLGVKIQKAPSLTDAAPGPAETPTSLFERGEAFCEPASFAVLFVTMMLYWIQGAYFPDSERLKKAGYAGMVSSNLLMAALLSFRWAYIGHFPLSNLYESLMFLSWGVSTVPLVLERQVAYGISTGAIFAPLVLFINAFATLILPPELQRASALVPALKSNWLMMHVSVMMLSYSILLAGSVMSMAYLFVSRNQDEDAPSALPTESSPSAPSDGMVLSVNLDNDIEEAVGQAAVLNLDGTAIQGPNPTKRSLADTLDDLSYRTLVLGFPLLTIGIISGAVWANEAWGSYWSWDPKETWALITWLVYSFYLHTRLNKGWRGKTSALVGASGFVVVWICYIGVNLFGVGLHSYGFFSQS